MKKQLYQLAYPFVLLFLHAAFLAVFSAESYIVPQFLFLFVIIIALRSRLAESLWLAAAAGFLLEIYSGLFFGAHIFSLVLIALIVYLATRNLTVQDISPAAAALLVLAGTIVYALFTLGYQTVFVFLGLGVAEPISSFVSASGVVTLVLNYLFFYPLRAVFIFFPKDEGPF